MSTESLRSLREKHPNLYQYVRDWNVVGVADLSWRVMEYRHRLVFTGFLFDEVRADDKCRMRFHDLREQIENEPFDREAFTSRLAAEPTLLHPTIPIAREAAPYLALCYSKVGGAFDINNFGPQYKTANSY